MADANQTMRVISDPMRRAILQRIWAQGVTVNELVQDFDVTQPAISFHLRVLRKAELVSVRREGTKRYYQALPEAFGELRSYLESHWDDRLAVLKDQVELEARRRRLRASGTDGSDDG